MKAPIAKRLGVALRDLNEAVARARVKSGNGYGSGLVEGRVRDYTLARDPSDEERLRHVEQICAAAADYRSRANGSKNASFTPDERAKLARAVNGVFRVRDELKRLAALRTLGMR